MSTPNSHPISLQFIDLSFRLPPHKNPPILHQISGQVSSGELLAVLGPSGSGKSTLLSLLSHRLPSPHSGTLLANGLPLSLSPSLSRRFAFVPQHDILYPHLTVLETLTFSALLKLPRSSDPSSLRPKLVAQSVDAVIQELGLGACACRPVGSVSGGERKRVSMGNEMMMSPSVVVVDEPTSGLDSTAAGRMVETLVEMARKGRAVVASLHQPSSAAYKAFDVVMLLGEGRCLYYGRGRDAVEYFGSLGFAMGIHVNPADFMLDLANGVAQIAHNGDAEKKTNVKQSLISSFDILLAPKVKAAVNASITASIASAKATARGSGRSMDKKEAKDFTRISWPTQFSILLHRSLKVRRHETFNSLRILQVVAVAFLAGSMWWHSSINNVHDRLGLLFFISIFWGVFASFNAVFTFPQEKPIFIKERSSGMYSLSSYFAVRMAGDLPMELILPSAFSTVLYWMAGLRPELGAFLLTLLVLLFYVLVAQGLGLALGAIVMDAKQASTMVTIIMLGFLLTGGFYVQNVPGCMAWVKYLSFTFYCFRLLIGVQYRDGMSSYLGKEDQAEDIESQVSVLVSVAALLGMFVGYRLLAYVALRAIKV